MKFLGQPADYDALTPFARENDMVMVADAAVRPIGANPGIPAETGAIAASVPGVDTLLGPEMRSTGEVMGIDKGFARAFLKSQLAAGVVLPTAGKVFISVKDADKDVILEATRLLAGLGFDLL